MHDDDKLKLARETYIGHAKKMNDAPLDDGWVARVVSGECDHLHGVQIALAAINALDPQLVEAVGRDVAETWKAKAENLSAALKNSERQILDDIAIMMSKHVTNWPEPKKIKTAIALIGKTLAASSEAVELLRSCIDGGHSYESEGQLHDAVRACLAKQGDA